jgi:alpha/beta superfamily hydrolase
MPSQAEGAIVERVAFDSGPYLLEGELAYGDSVVQPPGAAVLACSHPLLGGTMHNNVTRGVGDGLAERSWVSLRFNYRGVGYSQGPAVDVAHHLARFWQTSHVADEMDLWQDVQAAADFLHQVAPNLPLALIGYSFGCALLPQVRPANTLAAHILIAPPLKEHDCLDYHTVTTPVLVIASEDDFAVDGRRLQEWFAQLRGPKRLVRAALDNHFFRGHEGWLAETICSFLDRTVSG